MAIIGNNFLRNILFTLFLHQNTYNMDIIKKDPGYKEYISLLSQIKSRIKVSQIKATLSINAEMLYSYWFTGKSIIYMLDQKGWGKKIIQQLSKDLKASFPNEQGYSVRNLQYMRKFAAEYPFAFTQQVVAQLPDLPFLTPTQQPVAQIESVSQEELLKMVSWSHHCILMDKVSNIPERFWYIQQTVKNGWSRNILALQVESNLFERQVNVAKIQNYEDTLPPVQSDFAIQLLKDPYIFDFITLKEKMNEQDIEEQLCSHISNFLLELYTTTAHQVQPEQVIRCSSIARLVHKTYLQGQASGFKKISTLHFVSGSIFLATLAYNAATPALALLPTR